MRLDQALVTAGLAPSRSRAQALILSGHVRVAGSIVRKPSCKVVDQVDIVLTGDPNPWVSRAGLKLDHALKTFDLSPKGAVALDLGASTGGFTQVLLSYGAAHVFALDVGHGQLHSMLKKDLRVTNIEGVNARAIPDQLLPPLDWIVTDVSFISLQKALPHALRFARPQARLIALIKPQFEAGQAHIGKGGIVTDTAVHQAVRARIAAFLTDIGWSVTHEGESPVTGSDGNREFLIAAVAPGG